MRQTRSKADQTLGRGENTEQTVERLRALQSLDSLHR